MSSCNSGLKVLGRAQGAPSKSMWDQGCFSSSLTLVCYHLSGRTIQVEEPHVQQSNVEEAWAPRKVKEVCLLFFKYVINYKHMLVESRGVGSSGAGL